MLSPKKSQISGLAKIDMNLGVANFRINYLRKSPSILKILVLIFLQIS